MAAFADKILLKRIRAGNQSAWQEFVTHYQSRLFHLAHKKIKDRDACDDLVQETFLGFLTNLAKVDENRNYESYLYGILQKRIIDRLRRSYRSPEHDLGVDSSGNPTRLDREDSATGVSTWYRNEERRKIENDALADAIAALIKGFMDAGDYTKLKVMELLWVKGMDNLEAAAILHLDNKQVASIKFRAIEDIKAFLKQKDLTEKSFPSLQGHEVGAE